MPDPLPPELTVTGLADLHQREARVLPKDGPLVIVCHYGMRSQETATWLRRAGDDNAVKLSGGVDAWMRQVDPSTRRH